MAKRYFSLESFQIMFPIAYFRVAPAACSLSFIILKLFIFFFSPSLFYRISLCQLCFYYQDTRFDNPVTLFTDDELETMELRYYNAEVHKTAFTLPQFAKKVISTSRAMVEQELACCLTYGGKTRGNVNHGGDSDENVTLKVNSRCFQ